MVGCIRQDFGQTGLVTRVCWLLSLGIVKTGFRQSWIQGLEDLFTLPISALHVSGLASFSGRLSSHGRGDDVCSSRLLPCQLSNRSSKMLTPKVARSPWSSCDRRDLDGKPIFEVSLRQVESCGSCAHPWRHGEWGT